MGSCMLCPRKCGVDRDNSVGYCGANNTLKVARCALHMWEEDCISGKEGSGTVFFSGCNLRCVYCQNYELSHNYKGIEYSVSELAEELIKLQRIGANNINLVTPTHYLPQIKDSIDIARNKGLVLPIVYNTSGYENVDAIESLKGYVDVFLTDFKYYYNERALRYSKVSNYFEVASLALDKMFEIVGKPVFDGNGMLQKGIIVRHLMLPGGIKDSKMVLNYLYDKYLDDIYISIMSQYTPLRTVEEYPEINRKLYPAEYKRLVDYAVDLGIVNGFVQDMTTADESFIPDFFKI